MHQFADRVVFITGAGRGLGLAYARFLAERGATVLIQDAGADSSGLGENPEVAERAADELRSLGGEAAALHGDIATRNGCRALISSIIARHGRVDALIHNAGWVAHEPIGQIKEESLERMINIAAIAPVWLTQAVWPVMQAASYGRIVLTTSDRALYPQYAQRGLAAYAAAKLAAVGIVNVLALEGAEHNIQVNAISPVAKTRMWGVEGEPSELRAADVAPGVAFLASEACTESGWILRASNGQFHATQAREAAGVEYPRDIRGVRAATLEEVTANWSRIAVPAAESRK